MRCHMRVWDLPLRIFHWGLVIAIIGAVGSAKADVMWLHERFGLTVMGLVAFRIFWTRLQMVRRLEARPEDAKTT